MIHFTHSDRCLIDYPSLVSSAFMSRIKRDVINEETVSYLQPLVSFKDGIVSYKFSKPIENAQLPGFYHIPRFNGYSISRDGNVYSHRKNRLVTWHHTKAGRRNSSGGYYYSRMLFEGKSTCQGRHRLLAIVFCDYSEPFEILVANHLDGIPGNDHLDNLELVTRSENNQHAYDSSLRPNASVQVLSRHLLTGEIIRHVSETACGKYFGYDSPTAVRWRRLESSHKVFPDYLQFKLDDGTEWPDLNPKDVDYSLGKRTGYVFNVFTKEKIKFNTLVEAASISGIRKETVSSCIYRKRDIPLRGFLFRYDNDDRPWPIYPDRCLEIFKRYPTRPPNGVIVRDELSGDEFFFCSKVEAAAAFKTSPSYLCKLCKSNGLIEDRYRFEYYVVNDNIGYKSA